MARLNGFKQLRSQICGDICENCTRYSEKKYMLLGAMKNLCSKSIRALEALRFVMWEYVMLLGSYTWT
jgi:hypothetical protein